MKCYELDCKKDATSMIKDDHSNLSNTEGISSCKFFCTVHYIDKIEGRRGKL